MATRKLAANAEGFRENLGALSPAQERRLAGLEAIYGAEWIHDVIVESAYAYAFGEIKAPLKYIDTILQRWRAEGRDEDEIARRNDHRTARVPAPAEAACVSEAA
jgi:DNA replication protein DnaD